MQWKHHPPSIISYSRAKILSYLHINLGPYSQSTSCLDSFPKACSLHHPRYNPTSAARLWLSVDIFQRYIRITLFRAKFSCLWLMKAWCLCTSRSQQFLNRGSLNYHILQCSDFCYRNKGGKKAPFEFNWRKARLLLVLQGDTVCDELKMLLEKNRFLLW